MNHIEGANDSKNREGIVKHLIGNTFCDIPDIDCEGILLIYLYRERGGNAAGQLVMRFERLPACRQIWYEPGEAVKLLIFTLYLTADRLDIDEARLFRD